MIDNKTHPESVDYKKRKCYCFLWHEDKKILESQSLPYGYCGVCEVCGKPGHMRHGLTGPYTGAWCDKCWDAMLKERLSKK